MPWRPVRRPPRRRRDQGSATLEITVLFPAILLAIFGLVQGALYYHARDVALAAATDALAAARSRTGGAAEGRLAATSFVQRAGGDGVLASSTVTVVRTARTVRVTVSGHALSLLPGLPSWRVSQTASGPVERFTHEGEP